MLSLENNLRKQEARTSNQQMIPGIYLLILFQIPWLN